MIGSIKQWFINRGRLRNIVVFESNPDFACNTEPVYQYLKDRLPGYELVWICNGPHKKPGRKCLDGESSNPIVKLMLKYYRCYYKVAVSCNHSIRKRRSDQYSVFLAHGSKTKKTKGFYEMGKKVDFVNVQSHFFDDVTAEEYGCTKDQFVYLGYPRCDCFFNQGKSKEEIRKTLGLCSEDYLIWLPTYRKMAIRDDSKDSVYNITGMPLFYSEDDLSELNEYLKKRNVCIIYKPHPVQDISVIKSRSLSNVVILNDEELMAKDLQLYEVISHSKALITDYSSVYYDYLLLDRPIATTTDDLEAWKNNRGFAFDLESLYDRSTIRVAVKEELYLFIDDTLNGIDRKKEARQEICRATNMHMDGNSAERAGEFVLNLLRKMK